MHRSRFTNEQRFSMHQRKHSTRQLTAEKLPNLHLGRPVTRERSDIHRTIRSDSFWADRDAYQGDVLGEVNADTDNAIVHRAPNNCSITVSMLA